MDLVSHFRMLARYNRIANERLFERCAQLSLEEYQQQRRGSFGSIHGLLNHILLGDRVWMQRFDGSGRVTPALNTILFDDFSALRSARTDQDLRIEAFFENPPENFFSRVIPYTADTTDFTTGSSGAGDVGHGFAAADHAHLRKSKS